MQESGRGRGCSNEKTIPLGVDEVSVQRMCISINFSLGLSVLFVRLCSVVTVLLEWVEEVVTNGGFALRVYYYHWRRRGGREHGRTATFHRVRLGSSRWNKIMIVLILAIYIQNYRYREARAAQWLIAGRSHAKPLRRMRLIECSNWLGGNWDRDFYWQKLPLAGRIDIIVISALGRVP